MAEEKPKSLKQIRINTWLDACFQVSGCDIPACLHKKSGLDGEPNVWSRYKKGYKGKEYEPTPMTVNRVDQSLPGTAAVFLVGPAGLELWDVLEGNPSACEKQIDGVLKDFYKSKSVQSWMTIKKKNDLTLRDKCQALIEISVPSSWFEKPNDFYKSDEDLHTFWWADEDRSIKSTELSFMKKELHDKGLSLDDLYLSFEEVFKNKKVNILAQAYGTYKSQKSYEPKRDSLKVFKSHAPRYGEFRVANPVYQVALLAAAVQCFVISNTEADSEDLSDLYGYIIDGMLEAWKDRFGSEIVDFINKEFNY
ncbi:TPA: hypothetical protein R2K44_002407 [Raoultella ornithinolytica]|nr:hypothetical protein [Raoultella ornithinolytica]